MKIKIEALIIDELIDRALYVNGIYYGEITEIEHFGNYSVLTLK